MWKDNSGSSEPKVVKSAASTGKRVNSSEGLGNLLKNL
jgi:hypothetical protein